MDLSPNYQDIAEMFAVLTKPYGGELFPVHFQRGAELAGIILPTVDLARREFLLICIGNRPGSPFDASLCFSSRFFGGSWKSQDVAESCSKSIQDIFDFGFLTHFAFTEFPTRNNIQKIDPEEFRNKWLPESLLALIQMRDYVKLVPQIPIEGFFESWYELAVKNLVGSTWKISFSKRSTVRSYFRATFFTGLYLGVKYDLATKPIGT